MASKRVATSWQFSKRPVLGVDSELGWRAASAIVGGAGRPAERERAWDPIRCNGQVLCLRGLREREAALQESAACLPPPAASHEARLRVPGAPHFSGRDGRVQAAAIPRKYVGIPSVDETFACEQRGAPDAPACGAVGSGAALGSQIVGSNLMIERAFAGAQALGNLPARLASHIQGSL